MKINSNKPLPHLCNTFFDGELSDNTPYYFRNGRFNQNLVMPEWEALKKFAVPSKEETKEETEDVKESAPEVSKQANGSEDEPTKEQETAPEQPADEDDEADKEALEALKAQYSQMKSKNSTEGRALRAKIKELENK